MSAPLGGRLKQTERNNRAPDVPSVKKTQSPSHIDDWMNEKLSFIAANVNKNY